MIKKKDDAYSHFLILCLAVWVFFLLLYVVVGISLYTLDDYDSLYTLLNGKLLHMTYLSRVSMDFISMSQVSFTNILYVVLKEVQWYEVMVAALFIAAWPLLCEQKQTTWCLFLFVIETVGCLFCIYTGLQSASLEEGMFYIKGVGVILVLINTIIILLLLYHIKKKVHQITKKAA